MAALNITFGVELEFICVYSRSTFTEQYPDLQPNESEDGTVTAAHAIMYHLQQCGVPATGWEEIGTELEAKPYSCWTVDSDCLWLSDLERSELPPGYIQESIEVSSRIFPLTNDEWTQELEKVLTVLQLMKHRYGCIFLTNQTTGFHVHVGNGAKGMPFRTAQKVMQLLTAHERSFDAFHALNRVLSPSDQQATYLAHLNYAPLSFFHQHGPYGKSSNPFEWLKRIEACRSYEELGQLYHVRDYLSHLTGHNATVNFDNCFADPGAHRHEEELTRTIEFRQHAGTLDPLSIRAWVSLVCSVVQYCHLSRDDDFIHQLIQAADPDFTPSQLLRAIAVHPDVLAHYAPTTPDGPAIIGVLSGPAWPAHPVTTDADPLTRLAARNDVEESANAAQAGVLARVAQKYVEGYYGWDPAARPMPLTRSQVAWMLERAMQGLRRDQFPSVEHADAHARRLVLAQLGKVYDDELFSLDPCAALRVYLAGWGGR